MTGDGGSGNRRADRATLLRCRAQAIRI